MSLKSNPAILQAVLFEETELLLKKFAVKLYKIPFPTSRSYEPDKFISPLHNLYILRKNHTFELSGLSTEIKHIGDEVGIT